MPQNSKALRILCPVLLSFLLVSGASAQVRQKALAEGYLKSGSRTLRAFEPVETAVQESVVVVSVGGKRVALGTIVDAGGLLITKASEIKTGALSVAFQNGRKVSGEIVAVDDDSDLALVRVSAKGLKPIEWDASDTELGQWVATAGIGKLPEAVGIVSVITRKIPRPVTLVGIGFSPDDLESAKIVELLPGFGAAKSGLMVGDILVGVDGKDYSKRADVQAAIREHRSGQTVKLRVKRKEEELDFSVTLMTQDEAASAVRAAAANQSGRGRRGGISRADLMIQMGGDLSKRSEDFAQAIQHDTVLEPWQCGGPLVGLNGKAVGINIARADRVASYALPAALVKETVARLMSPATKDVPSTH